MFDETLEDDENTLELDKEEDLGMSNATRNNIRYRMTEKKAYYFYGQISVDIRKCLQ